MVDPGNAFLQLIAKLLIHQCTVASVIALLRDTMVRLSSYEMDCTPGENIAVQPRGINQDAIETSAMEIDAIETGAIIEIIETRNGHAYVAWPCWIHAKRMGHEKLAYGHP